MIVNLKDKIQPNESSNSKLEIHTVVVTLLFLNFQVL
jgi:hypothetical protein